jgi:hypothetical protein
MYGRDHFRGRVGKQHRDAVSHQHRHPEAGLCGHQRVAGRHGLALRTVYHADGSTVYLFHPHQLLRRQADAGG